MREIRKNKQAIILNLILIPLILITGFIMVSSRANADDLVEGNFKYNTYSANGYTTAYITGYNGKKGADLTIPDTLGGYPVTYIAWGAFSGEEFTGNLYIPDSVLAIDVNAFKTCHFGGDLYISKNCEDIGESAFEYCEFKGTVTIPEGLVGTHYNYGNKEAGRSSFNADYNNSFGKYKKLLNPHNIWQESLLYAPIRFGAHSENYTGPAKIINNSKYNVLISCFVGCGTDITTEYKNSSSGLTVTEGTSDLITKGTWIGSVKVKEVSLNRSDFVIKKGTSENLVATVLPDLATDKSCVWKSSNESIAKVDQKGKVTGVSAGTATITVTTNDGGKTASCTVKVVTPVEKVSISSSSLELRRGNNGKLSAQIAPSDASNKNISWSSSDYSVAKVDSEGNVTAVGRGNATITVTSADGGYTDICNVHVGLYDEWEIIGDRSYWYENDTRQGVECDKKCFWYEGTLRGREIYDALSDGWYWLDVNAEGAKAVGKEVFMPYIYQEEDSWSDDEKIANSNASDDGLQAYVLECIRNKTGKWVRYDDNGKMLKGWVTIEGSLAKLYPDQKGNTYYYDYKTGLMAKGWITLNGTTYHFDEVTGALVK